MSARVTALMMSCCVMAALALTPGTHPAPKPRRAPLRAVRADVSVNDQEQQADVRAAASDIRTAMQALELSGWDERATWALEDSVPKYSLEGGRVVLWRRMSLEVPELLTFSAVSWHSAMHLGRWSK